MVVFDDCLVFIKLLFEFFWDLLVINIGWVGVFEGMIVGWICVGWCEVDFECCGCGGGILLEILFGKSFKVVGGEFLLVDKYFLGVESFIEWVLDGIVGLVVIICLLDRFFLWEIFLWEIFLWEIFLWEILGLLLGGFLGGLLGWCFGIWWV